MPRNCPGLPARGSPGQERHLCHRRVHRKCRPVTRIGLTTPPSRLPVQTPGSQTLAIRHDRAVATVRDFKENANRRSGTAGSPMVHERLRVHIWVFEAASGSGEYLRHGGGKLGNVGCLEASAMTTGPSPIGRDGSLQSPWSVRRHRSGLHDGGRCGTDTEPSPGPAGRCCAP